MMSSRDWHALRSKVLNVFRNNMNRLCFIFILVFSAHSQSLAQNYQVTAIGFYNFENLFDTLPSVDAFNTAAYNAGIYPYTRTLPWNSVDSDSVETWGEEELADWLQLTDRPDEDVVYMDKRDDDFTSGGALRNTPEVYEAKLGKLAEVVALMGTSVTPDGVALLGVCEVEQRSVLEDFVRQEAVQNRNYQIIHHNSMDFRGIDNALLYQAKYFTPEQYSMLPVQIFSDKGERQFTRDILYVEGLLNGEKVHVFVNHWPSRSGGEQVTRHKREAAAQVCKDVIDSLKRQDPDVKVIVMGDFNDDPGSSSMDRVLQAEAKKENVSKFGMYNPFAVKHKKGQGTTAWRDAWSLFDQIVISPGLLKEDGLFFYKAEIFSEPFMIQKTGAYRGYPYRSFISGRFSGGYSDHFPVIIYLVKEVD
jgi:endonuclease/exonuclease/phosphatase family metal-dependent hydrolase